MKLVINFLMVSTLLMVSVQQSLGQKKNKKEQRKEQFVETQELLNAKQFIFVPTRAFPQGGRSIDLTTNYGFIKVMGEDAEGDLPYFGRGYTIAYGGDGGIKFDKTTIENEQVELNEKKMKIRYTFEAKGKNDNFRITMDVTYSGDASVSVISNNRSHISYNGEITPLTKDGE